MSKDKTQSAVDVIYELKDILETMTQQIKVVDNNVKLVNNKISKLTKRMNSLEEALENTSVKAVQEERREETLSDELVIGKIKLYGRIVNPQHKPISNVLVKVFNDKKQLVKTRKTDRDGYWDVRLPSGKYDVEYNQKGFKPVTLDVFLTNDMNSFEVK